MAVLLAAFMAGEASLFLIGFAPPAQCRMTC
jgi:hypothetical protein